MILWYLQVSYRISGEQQHGSVHNATKPTQKEQKISDQTCTQANMVGAFPLTIARDRCWWSHWCFLGSPNISTSFLVRTLCQIDWLKVDTLYRKEVAKEPPMDLLISKLIGPHHLAWSSSNKSVSLSLKRRHPSRVADTFWVSCANGFQFASRLGDLRFHNSDCLHVSIHGTSFSLLFSKLSV